MQFSTMSEHRKARLSQSCSRSVRSSITMPDISTNPGDISGSAMGDAKHWRPGSRLRKFPFMLRGIAPGTTVHELRQFLGQAGAIKDIYIPVHHINRTPRNYCFVEYQDEDDGKKALELLNGQIMNGVRVLFRVANSDPKTPEEMREVYDKRNKGNGRFDGRGDNSPYDGWRERSRSTPSVLRRHYRSRRYSHRDYRDSGYLSRRGYRSCQRSCSSSRSSRTPSYSRSRSCSRCHRERRRHYDSYRRAYYTRERPIYRRDRTSSAASTIHSVSSSSRSSVSRDSSTDASNHHRGRHLRRGRYRTNRHRSRSLSSSESYCSSHRGAKDKRMPEHHHRRRKRSASPTKKRSVHSRRRSRRMDKHHGGTNRPKKGEDSGWKERSYSIESLKGFKKRRREPSGKEKGKSRQRRTSSTSLSSCAVTGEVRSTAAEGTQNGRDGKASIKKSSGSSRKRRISSLSSNSAVRGHAEHGRIKPSTDKNPEKSESVAGNFQGEHALPKVSQTSNEIANVDAEDSGKKRSRQSDARHVEERRKRKHSKRS